jgi:hypothetical protein
MRQIHQGVPVVDLPPLVVSSPTPPLADGTGADQR